MLVVLWAQMSERSYTASSHGHQETPVCFCGLSCPLWTTWSTKNLGQRYIGCPKFRDGSGTHCKFFRWVDDPDNDHTHAMLFELMTKNKLLEDQLRHKKAVESRLYFLLIVLCGLCLGLSSMLMYIIFRISQGIERRKLPFYDSCFSLTCGVFYIND
jgi:hypothetical protein